MDSKCTAVYNTINESIDVEDIISRYYSEGTFFLQFFKKINSTEIIGVLKDKFDSFKEKLKNIIEKNIEKKILENYSIEADYKNNYLLKKLSLKYEKICKDKKIDIVTKIEELEKKYEMEEEIVAKKKKFLDSYLEIAEKEFNKYCYEVKERLYNDNYSAEEKVSILIYLSLINKDYKSICKMGWI